EVELFDRYPLTENDAEVTGRVARPFAAYFGDRAGELPQQSASEDFSDLPRALGAPYTYWRGRRQRPRRLPRRGEGSSGDPGHPREPLRGLRPGHPADARHRHPGTRRRRTRLDAT